MAQSIDLEYHKGVRFKNFRALPFVIDRIPKGILQEKRNNKEYYPIFDEKMIKQWEVSDKEDSKSNVYFYLGVCAFFAVFLPIYLSIGEDPIELIYIYILICIGLPFLIPAYLSWKKHKILPEQTYVTFDRLQSLITLPKINQLDYFTIHFKHLQATRRAVGARFYYSGPQLHFFIEPRAWRPWRHFDYLTMSHQPKEPREIWSLYVWYMDKNRPLPPGDAFDEFREKDFERRKADGFPAPLFKSLVPTPEATAEQQLVREAFWKDEDYVATETEAHFSLSPLSKHYKTVSGGEKNKDN